MIKKLFLVFSFILLVFSCDDFDANIMYIYYIDNQTEQDVFVRISLFDDSAFALVPANTKTCLTKALGRIQGDVMPRRIQIYTQANLDTPVFDQDYTNGSIVLDVLEYSTKINWNAVPDSMKIYEPYVKKYAIHECVIPITDELLRQK